MHTQWQDSVTGLMACTVGRSQLWESATTRSFPVLVAHRGRGEGGSCVSRADVQKGSSGRWSPPFPFRQTGQGKGKLVLALRDGSCRALARQNGGDGEIVLLGTAHKQWWSAHPTTLTGYEFCNGPSLRQPWVWLNLILLPHGRIEHSPTRGSIPCYNSSISSCCGIHPESHVANYTSHPA